MDVARAHMLDCSAYRCAGVTSRPDGIVDHEMPVGALVKISGVTYDDSGPVGNVTVVDTALPGPGILATGTRD
jgi:hypothetical protein